MPDPKTGEKSEHEELAHDEKRRAMRELRDQADQHDTSAENTDTRSHAAQYDSVENTPVGAETPRNEGQNMGRDERLAHDQRRDIDDDEGETKGAGEWPGEELTRNVLPNPDDGEIDEEREKLPDDIERDISREGVMSDPEKRVSTAP
jgi:hypothetical protein